MPTAASMNITEFEDFPDNARVWIYGLNRPVDEDTRTLVTTRLESFTANWKSHDVPITAGFALVEDRFLIISGYCADGISGCSMDSSVHVIQSLQEFGIDGLDRSLVFYRDHEGNVAALLRPEFQNAVNDGAIGPDTAVFDLTLQNLDDFKRGKFEINFGNCWHARAFKREA